MSRFVFWGLSFELSFHLIECLCAASRDACALFPCDRYSTSCMLNGNQFGNSSDRTCGACIDGFYLDGDMCVVALYQDTAVELIAISNIVPYSFVVAGSLIEAVTSLTVIDTANVLRIMNLFEQVGCFSLM